MEPNAGTTTSTITPPAPPNPTHSSQGEAGTPWVDHHELAVKVNALIYATVVAEINAALFPSSMR